MATILHPASFPIEQERDPDGFAGRFGQYVAGKGIEMRFLAYSSRCDLGTAKAAVQAQLQPRLALIDRCAPFLDALLAYRRGDATVHPAVVLAGLPDDARAALMHAFSESPLLEHALMRDSGTGAPDSQLPAPPAVTAWEAVIDALAALLWPIPWLNETMRFYDTLEADYLRAADYYLVTWEPPSVSAAGLASTLRHAIGRPVTIAEHLPRVLRCPYTPRERYLEPRERGAPLLAMLQSYDMRGDMHARTLHALMGLPFDLAIAIDIVTIPRGQAMTRAEWAQRAAEVVLKDPNLKDPTSARRKADAEYVQQQLAYEGLHDVQLAVMVTGETREALERHVEDVRSLLGSQLRLTRIESALVQHDLLRLFSTTPARHLNIPWTRRNVLSRGVGCMAGLLGYHRVAATDGLFWGIDSQRLAPIFVDLFAQHQAAHQIILGETGYGKTVFLNAMAVRAAAAGYRVISLDAFRNGDRVAAAVPAGACCYAIGLDTPINPLDVVAYDEADDLPGSWLPKQVQAVLHQLALLLGKPGVDADGHDIYTPRQFDIAERGVLDRALLDLYCERGTDPDTPVDDMPILSDLIDGLEQLEVAEAAQLARDLRILLFGHLDPARAGLTSYGHSFNAATRVDWHFEHDLTYYDFARVPDNLKGLYYVQAIGAIRRWMRDPRRDTRRPTLLQMDEFGYAAQVRAVLNLAIEICKTARKYRVGIMLIDQNPITFLSDDGCRLMENAAATIMFHMKDQPARAMAQALPMLTAEHIHAITGARPGECVAVIRQDAYPLSIQLNPKEIRAFGAS